MPEKFDSIGAASTTSYVTLYTCPANTRTTILSLIACSVATVTRQLYAQWLDHSASDAPRRLAHNLDQPAKATFDLVPAKPVILADGDVLQIKASATDTEFTLSYLEITTI